MLLDGLIDDVLILKDCAEGRIYDPLLNGGMDGQLSDNPMSDLRFLAVAGFCISREQRANQLVVIAQELNDIGKRAEQAFQHRKGLHALS
jgi:hypothetical protein